MSKLLAIVVAVVGLSFFAPAEAEAQSFGLRIGNFGLYTSQGHYSSRYNSRSYRPSYSSHYNNHYGHRGSVRSYTYVPHYTPHYTPHYDRRNGFHYDKHYDVHYDRVPVYNSHRVHHSGHH